MTAQADSVVVMPRALELEQRASWILQVNMAYHPDGSEKGQVSVNRIQADVRVLTPQFLMHFKGRHGFLRPTQNAKDLGSLRRQLVTAVPQLSQYRVQWITFSFPFEFLYRGLASVTLL